MPKISIIIPVYNVEKYLRECLDSVVNQTLQDIEIICVNDCSTDTSLEILKEYAQKDARIVVIDKDKNEGLGITRNIGQKAAKGKYILFLDSDDYIATDACEKLYNKIEQDNVDVVLFNVNKFVDGSKNYINKINLKTKFKEYYTEAPFIAEEKYYQLLKLTRQVWFKIYNRNYLERNNIFCSEDRMCEDSLFTMKLLLTNPKVSLLNETLIFYRLREGSLITKGAKNIDILFTVYNNIIDLIIDSNLSRRNKLLFIKRQINWIIFWSNKSSYPKDLLVNNIQKRRESYWKILNYFSYYEIINTEFHPIFWKDLTEFKYGIFSLYSYYKLGKLIYKFKIKIFGVQICVSKSIKQ